MNANQANSTIQQPAHFEYPVGKSDRRIAVTGNDDFLMIRIRRASSFWQPTTLVAIILIVLPIAGGTFFIGIWGGYNVVAHQSAWNIRSEMGSFIFFILISLAVLLATFLSACKTTIIIANRERLVIRTRWLIFHLQKDIPVTVINGFFANEGLLPILGRNGRRELLSHDLYVVREFGKTSRLFRTVRLPASYVQAIASALSKFYKAGV